MKQTCQNPSEARQARRVTSAPKNKEIFPLTAFIPEDAVVREKRARVHFTGEVQRGGEASCGTRSMSLLNMSADKNMGYCRFQNPKVISLFPEGTSIYV